MKQFHIAVIAGDGIGPEVIAEGKKVFSGIAQMDGTFSVTFEDFPWGCEYYLKSGEMMPENGLDLLRGYDALYLGAVGYPGVPDHVSLGDLLLRIHQFTPCSSPARCSVPARGYFSTRYRYDRGAREQ